MSSGAPKHQSFPNGNANLLQYNINNIQNIQNYYNRQNYVQGSNQSMHSRFNSNFNQIVNIHLACNKCGENLMNKPSLSMDNRNTSFSSHQRTHANTISTNLTGNIFNANNSNHLMNNLLNSNHYYQPNLQGNSDLRFLVCI